MRALENAHAGRQCSAAANQQNDKYDDEKRGGIHVELLLAVPCVFSHFAYALPLQPTFLIPIRSYEMPGFLLECELY